MLSALVEPFKFNGKPVKPPYNIQSLLDIMSALRTPETGCPWDLKQSYKSIIPYTLEEAYEVAEAIENEDFEELKGELGDLVFQVVFYSQLAQEEGRFAFSDVINAICEKLVRRHPHVFSSQLLKTEAEIKANWENEKQKERQARLEKSSIDSKPVSMLADIPNALPALTRANKIQKRCAHVGFDWPDHQGAMAKVEEEIIELKDELNADEIDPQRIGEEMGDLMFAMVNLSRKLKLDPEATLRDANIKFSKRFQQVEALAHDGNQRLDDLDLDQMEALWQQVKALELKRV